MSLLIFIAWILFPNTPNKLTVIDQQQISYFSTCPTLVNTEQKQSSKALKPTFSLLNWNIYKQQNEQWSEKLNEWVGQADLITLQEAKHSPALINFSEQQNLYYFQNVAFIHHGNNYGVDTFSRTQAQQVCGTRYLEPWILIPKTGLASTYQIQDSSQTLLLINLHGVNFTFTAEPLKEQVTPYLELIRQHKGPVIFTGDLNTWSDARTSQIKNFLASTGFDETKFSDDNRITAFGLPLDHVFYRGLKVIKAQSISTIASDHSPQLVTFSLLAENKN
ncbi:endonuclease/exonuclease/phosphatase family protein [Psychromonas algarum]|uniref:endonuclease/exonuclease/phosphatase family protein n=1 Tax=Psychromonas algarum TaxID=2555643 RepID=UPI001FBB6667|nr:endonuclease/exonuclease/phosphatase family protein [Psychromonas sp. RZ22]